MQLVWSATVEAVARADSPPPLDLQEYTTELNRWSEAASRLREHPEKAAALRKELPDYWSIAVQEQRFLVPTEWLGAALDRLAVNPKLAKGTSEEICVRLESMLQDSQAFAHVSEPNFGLARARLDNILKRREFRSARAPTRDETIWDRLREWAWKSISRLFSNVEGHPRLTMILIWGVVMALGLIFLGWLIYSFPNLSLAKLSSRRVPAEVDSAAPAENWRAWVEHARAAAARGEYRDAVRLIYGASLRRLGEAGTWQVDPARTHREYVRLVPEGSFRRPLIAITTCFESVWYGQARASAVDYEAVLAELESLR